MKKRKTNKAKRVDPGCRNHGSCPVCRGNRQHQLEVANEQLADEMRESIVKLGVKLREVER